MQTAFKLERDPTTGNPVHLLLLLALSLAFPLSSQLYLSLPLLLLYSAPLSATLSLSHSTLSRGRAAPRNYVAHVKKYRAASSPRRHGDRIDNGRSSRSCGER